VASESKIGRNDPCPCGSGTKYKNCHYGQELTEDGEPASAGASRLLIALCVVGVVISAAVGWARQDVMDGVVVLVSCGLGIGGFAVLRKPPPSNPNAGAPGGINFGN